MGLDGDSRWFGRGTGFGKGTVHEEGRAASDGGSAAWCGAGATRRIWKGSGPDSAGEAGGIGFRFLQAGSAPTDKRVMRRT